MNHSKSIFLAFASMGLALSSCVDNNYDLSDIDTTVRVDVKDLIVPINLDPLELNNVFDIKEGDRIQVINGQYVLRETGTFESDVIEVNTITLNKPSIDPTESIIHLDAPSQVAHRASSSAEFTYKIASDATGFDYEATEVSDYITRIDIIGGQLELGVEIKFNGISETAKSFTLKNAVIQLPKGLNVIEAVGQSYDKETGELTLATTKINGNTADFKIEANSIDFNLIGGTYDYESAVVKIKGEMFVKEGLISFTEDDLLSGKSLADLPATIKMLNTYDMSDFIVTEFTGQIRYDVDGVDVNDIDLDDIPDFLAQEGTDIELANPQLYIHVNNPLQNYSLYAETGLSITAYHKDNAAPSTYSIDNNTFTIPNTSSGGDYNFCLSPENPANPIEGYSNPIYVPFTSLGKVLSGNGLPSRLGIDLDPVVPSQDVNNFALGQNIGAVDGQYEFYAPIELKNGSIIAYRDTVDGWSSEDLDYLTITALEINLNVTSDMPMSAVLEGYPIDVNGNQINNVTIEGADIAANAKDQAVKIHITGTVAKLDGIIFKALIKAEDQRVLQPDMKLTLENVRPKVTGYYQKEL